jgi:hypothetical protein
LYGGVCLAGTVFTAIFVPETRGKSIEDIQRFFEGKRRPAAALEADKSALTPLRPLESIS